MTTLLPDVICVIPARGNSSRIPRKNIAPIAGRPCLAYTLDHLDQMETPHERLLITEDARIAEVAADLGLPVLHEESDWLTAEFELVAMHAAISRLEVARGRPFDQVVLAYGCCPIRPPGIFDRLLTELQQYEADVVQSICPVPVHLHPFRTFSKLRGGDLQSLFPEGRCLACTQDLPTVWAMTAAGVAMTRAALRDHRYCGLQRCRRYRGVVHGPDEFLDIDFPEDLQRAEMLLLQSGKGVVDACV